MRRGRSQTGRSEGVEWEVENERRLRRRCRSRGGGIGGGESEGAELEGQMRTCISITIEFRTKNFNIVPRNDHYISRNNENLFRLYFAKLVCNKTPLGTLVVAGFIVCLTYCLPGQPEVLQVGHGAPVPKPCSALHFYLEALKTVCIRMHFSQGLLNLEPRKKSL